MLISVSSFNMAKQGSQKSHANPLGFIL